MRRNITEKQAEYIEVFKELKERLGRRPTWVEVNEVLKENPSAVYRRSLAAERIMKNEVDE